MEINQLRYLVKLAEVCNFSKAAEELYIAQPTLSQQISKLEEELGVQLFKRSTRNVTLTDIGTVCVSYASEVLNNLDAIKSSADAYQRKEKSRLRIGVLNFLPRMDIINVISVYEAKHPDIHIEWHFGWSIDLMEQLLEKKVDVVIANITFDEDEPRYREIEIQSLWEDRLVTVVNRESLLAKYKVLTFDNIMGEKFWMVDNHSSVKLGIEHALVENSYPIPEFKECNSMSSVFKMIVANQGISIMSFAVAQEYLVPQVKIIPLEPLISTKTAIIHKKDKRGTSKQSEFTQFLLSEMKKSARKTTTAC